MQNLKFENILNDAIDSDFSELEIVNSEFKNIGNDAIDGSGSSIIIEKNKWHYYSSRHNHHSRIQQQLHYLL